jgi:hypothetical protein
MRTFIDIVGTFKENMRTFIENMRTFIENMQTFIDIVGTFKENIGTFIDIVVPFKGTRLIFAGSASNVWVTLVGAMQCIAPAATNNRSTALPG